MGNRKPQVRISTLSRCLMLSLAVTAGGMLPLTHAHAQSQSPATSAVQFNIPAGDLAGALDRFAEQSGLQIASDQPLSQALKSAALRGRYTPEDALNRLLQGTGLTWEWIAGGAVVIRKANAAPAPAPAAPATSSTPAPPPEVVELETMIVRGSAEMLADATSLNADIRRSEDDSQPYVVISRADIESSGVSNVQELLRRSVPMATDAATSQQNPGFAGSSSVNLRGLGADQTLILVDGRRIASRSNQGFQRQPDINGIPLGAIERIEVLPTTSSGIYGGGATGGVVNIILRRDYAGFELAPGFEIDTRGDAPTKRLDANAGLTFNGGRTTILAYGTYSDADALVYGDRDLYQRGLARLFANNPDQITTAVNPPLGATANIRSTNGANLTLKPGFGGGALGSTITHIPVGYVGPQSDNGAGLIANAGRYNLDLPDTAQTVGLRRTLLRGSEMYSAGASARHSVSSSVALFVDGFYSHSRSVFDDAPSASSTITLGVADAGNPFEQPISVTVPLSGADMRGVSVNKSARVTAGATFDLPRSWRGAVDLGWSWTSTYGTQAATSLDGGQTAAVRTGALNVFRDFDGTEAFAAFLRPNGRFGPGETDLYTATLRLSGPLGPQLPGGRPILSMFAERRFERLGSFTSVVAPPTGTTVQYPREAASTSAYAELTIPFFGPDNGVRGLNLLEFQAAVRGDWYDVETSNASAVVNDEFTTPRINTSLTYSSTNPTLALRWKPSPDVMLRGSWGEGFNPPFLPDLTPNPATGVIPALIFQALNVRDPQRGNELLGNVTVVSGGNPDLKPETSTSRSAGVVLTPRFLPGFRLSADWTRITKRDNVSLAVNITCPQCLLDTLEFFPDRITRSTDPATFGGFDVGPIIAADTRLVNVAQSRVEAIDFGVDQSIETDVGGFVFAATATRFIENSTQSTPAAPFVDRAGERNFPEWRASGSLTYRRGSFEARWSSTYVSSYCVTELTCAVNFGQGSARIGSQIYHDLFMSYDFGSSFPGTRNAQVQFGITNIFDQRPPIDLGSTLFYSPWGDPRGARVFATLRLGF